ncbi:serine/threonine kinase [Schistosoma mansoni]|uniref:serine/threonine kinase n=1 Tax=Schistosoma mansoni TaxID=6183 RepID=UPI00022DC5DF|nr:serine/threonine kinase [Schistosoma mansoni]|eukprot:XP_018648738.1 serine/threonine kinase [Schistosoma mansoni]
MLTSYVNTKRPTIFNCRISSSSSNSNEDKSIDNNCSNHSATNIMAQFVCSRSKSIQHTSNINTGTASSNTNTTATHISNHNSVVGDGMNKFTNTLNNHILMSDPFIDTNTSTTHAINHINQEFGLKNILTERNIFDKFLSCFRPFIYLIQKEKSFPSSDQDLPWEVPFESVTDLVWIGSGAQGVVFRGCFRDELIAVKKVNKQSDTDIRHLRYLNHPNVIKFKGVCVEQPCYCILMEYCPYGQLYEIIHSGNPISPSLICSWVKQIADGMHYLHSCKIIHRDLKSPNVLVGYNHVLKISDFGASREWTENSTKMSFTGTVAWMAPEVIRNEPCSFKVDVWSYGVLLWELLTGEIPYHNVDSTAILWGVGSENLRLPVPVTCPSELRVLMKTCWNIKPRNRPSFRQILSHLNVTCSRLLQYTDDEFISLRQLWKEEITVYLQDIRLEGQCTPKLEVMLIRRRREELCHAQDIRRCYDDKRERANELYMELKILLAECEEEKRKAERERLHYESLIQELNTNRKQQQNESNHQEYSTEETRIGDSEKLQFFNTENTNDCITTTNQNKQQFPFSTLSTFSLGRKLNDFYYRRRNDFKLTKPILQSSFILPSSIGSNHNTNSLIHTTDIIHKSNIDRLELLKNHYYFTKLSSLEQFNEIYHLGYLIYNSLFNTTTNNNNISSSCSSRSNKKQKCPFCGNLYSSSINNNIEFLRSYHHQHHLRRALTLSMLEYKLKDQQLTDSSMIYNELYNTTNDNNNSSNIQPSSLLYNTKKQFASTNSLHQLVNIPPPPPPPAYDSVITTDNEVVRGGHQQNVPGQNMLRSDFTHTSDIHNNNNNKDSQTFCNHHDHWTDVTSSSSSVKSVHHQLGDTRTTTCSSTTDVTTTYTTTATPNMKGNNNSTNNPNKIQSDVMLSSTINNKKTMIKDNEMLFKTGLSKITVKIDNEKSKEDKTIGIPVNIRSWLDPIKNSSLNDNPLTSKYDQTNYRLKRSISQDSLFCYLRKLQSIKDMNEKCINTDTTINTTTKDNDSNTVTSSKNQFPLINKKFSSCLSILSIINNCKSLQHPCLPMVKEFPHHINNQYSLSPLKVINERDYLKANIIHQSFIHHSQSQQISSMDDNCLNESQIDFTPDKTIQNQNLKILRDNKVEDGDCKIITTVDFPFLEHVNPLWSPSKDLFRHKHQMVKSMNTTTNNNNNNNSNNNKGDYGLLLLPTSISPKYSASIPTVPRRSNSNKINVSHNNNNSVLNQTTHMLSVVTTTSSYLPMHNNNNNSKENLENENIQLRKYPGRRNFIINESYLKNSSITMPDQISRPFRSRYYHHRHRSRLYSFSQPRRNSSSLLDLNSNYRSTSFSASSSPLSSSIGTRTHMSIENLANELQSHMIDSLSDKEYHVRRVCSRLRKQQQQYQKQPIPIQFTTDDISAPNPASLTSSPLPLPIAITSLHGSCSKLIISNDDNNIINEENPSIERVRSIVHHLPDQSFTIEKNNLNSQLCTPNSKVFMTSTCTTISSITEAEVDLSDDDDDNGDDHDGLDKELNENHNDHSVLPLDKKENETLSDNLSK